jgi:hypothetical protein
LATLGLGTDEHLATGRPARARNAIVAEDLVRDDGRLLGGSSLPARGAGAGLDTDAYVYTAAYDALRRLGACWSDDAARSAVERAVGTEEGMLWLESRPGRT